MKRFLSLFLIAVLVLGISGCKRSVTTEIQGEVKSDTEEFGTQDNEFEVNATTQQAEGYNSEKSAFFAPAYQKPIYKYIEALEERNYQKYIEAKFTKELKQKCVDDKFDGNENSFENNYQNTFESIMDDYAFIWGEEFEIQILSSEDHQNNDDYNLQEYSKKLTEKYGVEVELTDFYTCILDIYVSAGEESESTQYIARTGEIDGEWKLLYFYENI